MHWLGLLISFTWGSCNIPEGRYRETARRKTPVQGGLWLGKSKTGIFCTRLHRAWGGSLDTCPQLIFLRCVSLFSPESYRTTPIRNKATHRKNINTLDCSSARPRRGYFAHNSTAFISKIMARCPSSEFLRSGLFISFF